MLPLTTRRGDNTYWLSDYGLAVARCVVGHTIITPSREPFVLLLWLFTCVRCVALTLRCCCCHNLLMFHFEGYQRSEKFWSHIDVVSCCMMLCPIVSVIELAWTPVKAELLLCFSIAEPMESHIHCFGSFGCDFTIDDCVCHGIICLDGSGWLFVAHLLQNDSYVHCLSCHDV